jgi:hypothetical protein
MTAGAGARSPTELLARGAPLPASGFQHFLVLLLAHPLAALLYQRTHVGPEVSGCRALRAKSRRSAEPIESQA